MRRGSQERVTDIPTKFKFAHLNSSNGSTNIEIVQAQFGNTCWVYSLTAGMEQQES